MSNFEDEYLDVLQNIEFSIVSVYRRHPELIDYDVEQALRALLLEYQDQQRNRLAREPRLDALAQQVYEGVRQMCEWRLGRESLDTNNVIPATSSPLTLDEVVACLKRIRKSVQRWKKEDGRQGYLQFVDGFIA
jgi:hypothetical protein